MAASRSVADDGRSRCNNTWAEHLQFWLWARTSVRSSKLQRSARDGTVYNAGMGSWHSSGFKATSAALRACGQTAASPLRVCVYGTHRQACVPAPASSCKHQSEQVRSTRGLFQLCQVTPTSAPLMTAQASPIQGGTCIPCAHVQARLRSRQIQSKETDCMRRALSCKSRYRTPAMRAGVGHVRSAALRQHCACMRTRLSVLRQARLAHI